MCLTSKHAKRYNREEVRTITDLVFLKNDEAVCDSLQVAEKFGKRHQEILYTIEGRKCSCNGEGCNKCNNRGYQQLGLLQEDLEVNAKSHLSKMFIKSSYRDDGGRKRPLYLINRDGFSLLVMGFTGKKALEWKLQYIKAFNAMENFIKEKSTQQWIETRKAGKLTRKAETDTIKRLVDYAKDQGSTHADMLYMTYSKLANKMAGIKTRNQATIMQLNNLSLIENIILHVIDTGILMQKHYKEIYQDCKKRLEQVKDLAYLDQAS